ncbi:Tango1, partial [Trypoxylus dichotomus]
MRYFELVGVALPGCFLDLIAVILLQTARGTINSVSDTLNLKYTENDELQLELETKNKKVTHLQTELGKMAMNLFKVEEDKEQMQAKLEGELKDQLEKEKNSFNSTRTKLLEDISDKFNQTKFTKNNAEALQYLLNPSVMKVELQSDNQTMADFLKEKQQPKFTLEKQMEVALQEAQDYKDKYDESDNKKLK